MFTVKVSVFNQFVIGYNQQGPCHLYVAARGTGISHSPKKAMRAAVQQALKAYKAEVPAAPFNESGAMWSGTMNGKALPNRVIPPQDSYNGQRLEEPWEPASWAIKHHYKYRVVVTVRGTGEVRQFQDDDLDWVQYIASQGDASGFEVVGVYEGKRELPWQL